MNVSISPSVRIAALVGLLGACVLGSAALLLARHQAASTVSAPTAPVVHHHAVHGPLTRPHVARTRHHRVPTTSAPSAPKVVVQKPKPIVMPATSASSHVPTAVAAALKNHPVVVAALYAPDGASDPTAVAEAQAGARLAGAGFVKLDVLNETVADQLARVADNLTDPAVLVFERSGSVAVRIDGFADRDVVAQAADNTFLK